MTIETKVSEHALRQSQRRGISRETLDLVLTYHDRSRKVPGYARALWIGPRGRKALIRAGLPVALIERCAGVRAIVHLGEDLVLTVEHSLKRRAGFSAVAERWRRAGNAKIEALLSRNAEMGSKDVKHARNP